MRWFPSHSPPASDRGHVYIAVLGERVKIGWSADLHAREGRLRREHGHDLRFVRVAIGDRRTERALHARFGALWLDGEWFARCGELVALTRSPRTVLDRGAVRHRRSRGGAYAARGRVFLRVTIGTAQRRAEFMPWVTPEDWAAHDPSLRPCTCVACERARDVQALVTRLRLSGNSEFVERLVVSAAKADAVKFAEIDRAVDGIVRGEIVRAPASPEVGT